MALSRRTGQRFQASIWPGFVDAITALLLVLIFILTIFMAVQFVLRDNDFRAGIETRPAFAAGGEPCECAGPGTGEEPGA